MLNQPFDTISAPHWLTVLKHGWHLFSQKNPILISETLSYTYWSHLWSVFKSSIYFLIPFLLHPCLFFWSQGQPEGHGLIRAVNSYAGFTEFDKNPTFLHPESSKFTIHKLCKLFQFSAAHKSAAVSVNSDPGNMWWLVITHCVSVALTKKDRSRVSAEDILIHEDPRTAVLVSTHCVQNRNIQLCVV